MEPDDRLPCSLKSLSIFPQASSAEEVCRHLVIVMESGWIPYNERSHRGTANSLGKISTMNEESQDLATNGQEYWLSRK